MIPVLNRVSEGGRELRRLIEQSYYVARVSLSYSREMRTIADPQGELILMTMGKVGSMTLFESLRAEVPQHRMRVDKAHCVSVEGVNYYRRIFEAGYAGWHEFPKQTKTLIARRMSQARRIRKGLRRGEKFKIVVVIRDPVATNLSGFFHNYAWWPKKLQRQCREASGPYLEKLRNQFIDTYPHDIPLTWFDMELSTNFDVDFFAQAFPHSKGYEIYRNGSADILILRLENLNTCAAQAFADFLDLDDFRLQKKNEASDKWYDRVYKEFRESVALPDSYLDRMYDSRWYRHFYSPEELANFRQRWSKKDA